MNPGAVPLLQVRGLEKTYPSGFQALRGIDLDVEAGEFLVIIGLSGAGKSTLLRCINRLVEPTAGAIRFADRDITAVRGRELRRVRREIAMIFQQFNLVKRASVLTNVLTGALEQARAVPSLLNLWPHEQQTRAQACLELVGLPDQARRRADALSGGQQQRVAIARALMQQPRMLLADEPVASLDPATSHSVMRHLKALQEEHGITVLANLHFLSLAREYGTRVVALKDGRKVFDGPPTEITDAKFAEIYGEDAAEVEIR